MKSVILFSVLALIVVATAQPCRGANVFGTATTEFAWWQDLVTRDTKYSAYQYLRAGAQNLFKGQDMSVYAYGRYGFNTAASPEGNGRLYYAYLDWRDVIKDRVDMMLGRTWTNLVAGSTIIDGAQLDFKNIGLGPVAVTLLGGQNISFDEFNTFDHSSDTAWGGQIYLRDVKNLNLNLSFFEKYLQGDLAQRTVAYDFGYNIKDISRVYSEARYDLIKEQFGEFLAGVKVYPNDKWTFRGEYYFSNPTFDATSIYAVFAAGQFQSGTVSANYAVSDTLSFYGSYEAEFFTAPQEPTDMANVFTVGTNWTVKEINLNGSIIARDGFPGNDVGFTLAANRLFLDKKLDLGAGIDYDVFERTEDVFQNATTGYHIATKFWLSGQYYFSKKVSLTLHVEDTISPNQDYNFAGWSTLQINF